MLNGLIAVILGFASSTSFARVTPTELQTRVVVIGAGVAGLQAADLLRRAHIPTLILEASERAGGRLYSRPAANPALGLVLDEGANLINSTDRVALSLLERFHIRYVRRLSSERAAMIYLFGERVLNQAEAEVEIFTLNKYVMKRLATNQRRRAGAIDRGFMNYLTEVNIAEYLRELGAGSRLTLLLCSFFWSEYGKPLEELNGHVLHDYFAVDWTKQNFKLIPYTDEAYLVPGGAGQIAGELAMLNAENLLLSHRVTAVQNADRKGQLVVTAVKPGGQAVRVRADYVIYAAPLHRLREITVNVAGVDGASLAQARTVSYANGVKLHLQFSQGFRDHYKFPGILVTDTGEQIWSSSLGQTGSAGLLTVLTGPMVTTEAAVQTRVARVLQQLERVAPGVSKYYVGVERTDAPFSYSGALQPGETNALSINADHGRWITVGEASGGTLQGYVEGALESATRRTRRLISILDPRPRRVRDCEARLERAI